MQLTDKQRDAGLVTARFPSLNKQDKIEDYERQLPETGAEPIKVVETITLTPQEYEEFTHNLLTDRDWLAGKGGTSSLADLPDVEEFFHYTEEQRAAFIRESYQNVLEVQAEGKRTLYVDPQGYDYARYVGFRG